MVSPSTSRPGSSEEQRIGGLSPGSPSLLSCSSTAWTMGTIMAVVAVLLIHMDRKAVTPMKPSIRLEAHGTLSQRDGGVRCMH